MQKHLLTILFSLLAVLTALSQDLYTTIDVLRPGCIKFPESVKNVLIVNNAVQQPDDYGHQSHLSGMLKTTMSVNTDSAIFYFLTTLSQNLEDQRYFQTVDLLETSQNRSNEYFTQSALTSLQIDHLRRKYDADAIICLNRLILSDIVEDYVTEFDDYYASLEVHCVSVWNIFMPDQERASVLTLADTLIWEERDYRRSDAINALPDRRNALLDMAIYSAAATGHKMLPHWEQRDRFFYTHSDRQMKAAIDAFYHKEWDQAIDLWYAAYQRGNAKIKAYAAANMAATFEIDGDLNSALYWAQQAATHFGERGLFRNPQQQTNMQQYAKELTTRIEEEKELNR